MFQKWTTDRLQPPFVIALVGGRRMGKSCAMTRILLDKQSEFDLVIAFTGNRHCCPEVHSMMEQFWDSRFFFETWNPELVDRLVSQQIRLMDAGNPRRVCIVMDDCVLNSRADEQLAHMAMRGRHFNISLIMCSVSYTAVNKRVRRSLDQLFVFSLPMKGNQKVLVDEYCQSNSSTAMFGLKNLPEHTAMVFETCKKQQLLLTYRAELVKKIAVEK